MQQIFPVTERVRQLPGQGFMVSHGKVFRQLFAEELSNDKDTCKSHIGQSSSCKPGSRNQHEINLAKWEAKKDEGPGRKLRLEKWGEGRAGGKAPETTRRQGKPSHCRINMIRVRTNLALLELSGEIGL